MHTNISKQADNQAGKSAWCLFLVLFYIDIYLVAAAGVVIAEFIVCMQRKFRGSIICLGCAAKCLKTKKNYGSYIRVCKNITVCAVLCCVCYFDICTEFSLNSLLIKCPIFFPNVLLLLLWCFFQSFSIAF